MNWYGIHIHYHDPQDGLLADGIGQLVASYRGERLARWFFLRYWRNGPHVRLRLLLQGSDTAATLQAAQRRLSAYLAQVPSTTVLSAERLTQTHRLLAELQREDDGSHELFPNNTVRLQPYTPEHGKYGGGVGVELAERLFEHSSDSVLEVLGNIRQVGSRRLGIGFAMMLAGLRAAGLNEAGIIGFLANYCRFWSRYASSELAATWPSGLAGQRRVLSAHAAAVLSNQPLRGSITGGALAGWTSAVSATMESLDARASDILPAVTMLGPDASLLRRRDFVLLNYLHTHNNRLGVIPAQEAYLAYLGHHIVCGLAGLKPQEELVASRLPALAG